jgi:hypothetical protein
LATLRKKRSRRAGHSGAVAAMSIAICCSVKLNGIGANFNTAPLALGDHRENFIIDGDDVGSEQIVPIASDNPSKSSASRWKYSRIVGRCCPSANNQRQTN